MNLNRLRFLRLLQTNLIGVSTLFAMQKFYALIIAIVFVGASLTNPASGAVKAGRACTKAGATSRELYVIKASENTSACRRCER